MREIKFRAWDGKKMRVVLPVNFEEESQDYDNPDFAQSAAAAGWKLMQFTGLKDVNGKEIYEGDIVQVIGAATPFKQAFIEFVRGGFCLRLDGRKKKPWYICNLHCDDMKIIGHIYENKAKANDRTA